MPCCCCCCLIHNTSLSCAISRWVWRNGNAYFVNHLKECPWSNNTKAYKSCWSFSDHNTLCWTFPSFVGHDHQLNWTPPHVSIRDKAFLVYISIHVSVSFVCLLVCYHIKYSSIPYNYIRNQRIYAFCQWNGWIGKTRKFRHSSVTYVHGLKRKNFVTLNGYSLF